MLLLSLQGCIPSAHNSDRQRCSSSDTPIVGDVSWSVDSCWAGQRLDGRPSILCSHDGMKPVDDQQFSGAHAHDL